MRKIIKQIFFFCFIFTVLFTLDYYKVFADDMIMSARFDLSRGIDSDNSITIEMNDDGNVKFSATVEDTDTIPGKMKVTISKKGSDGTYSIVVKTFTDISSTQGIDGIDFDLEKGDYLILSKIYTDSGDITDSSLKVNMSMYLNYVIEPTPPPAPENISAIPVDTLTEMESSFEDNFSTITLGEGLQELILPFTVKQKGGINVQLEETDTSYGKITAAVYKDKACTTQIGDTMAIVSGDESTSGVFTISKAGTYYIKFNFISSYYKDADADYKINIESFSGGNRTLKNGSVYGSYQDKTFKKIIYKIWVPQTGDATFFMIPINQSPKDTAKISLLDKNKKKISTSAAITTTYDDSIKKYVLAQYYTIKKGTYYIQVESTCGIYFSNYNFTKLTDQSGASKAKATSLKVGGAGKTGGILLSDKTSTADWYKFTLSSNRKTTISIDHLSDGPLKCIIYDSKGNEVYKMDLDAGSYNNYCYSIGKWSKGTYYIKIYKTNKLSSMDYTISVS